MYSKTSSFDMVGGTVGLADYIYYNADIISNRTDSTAPSGTAVADPDIRFNETRDTALIKDASQYYFSIIRFTMNGANRDLPLFIPVIQVGQPNVNLTTYQLVLTHQQTVTTAVGPVAFNISPTPTTIIYTPETQNTLLAPIPPPPLTQQNLSSRYYWVYTYQHWLDIINNHYLIAHTTLYNDFVATWNAGGGVPGAYGPLPAFLLTFAAFQAYVQTPCLRYNPESKLFTFTVDSDGYGQRLNAAAPAPAVTNPVQRMFFNTNLFGLFANFNNLYWNQPNIGAFTVNANYILPAFPNPVPIGYTNEILFVNTCFQNVQNWALAPYNTYVPAAQQKKYWETSQDYLSITTLWSPIASIVFSTTLLPIKSEATGQPNILGTSNLGDSQPTSLSGFQPIITDISLDLFEGGGAQAYRGFIYYAPTAEYRLADLSPSKQEVRNVDIQVFWKNRLNNQLYPISMYNCSSVSLKMMFVKKSAKGKIELN